jgi:hypothetical protein
MKSKITIKIKRKMKNYAADSPIDLFCRFCYRFAT